MFLTRIKRKMSFCELGYLYGCGKESARRYFWEIVDSFQKNLVPRLVFPRTPKEDMTRQQVNDEYPDLLAILDATNWEQLKPENFLENRLSYSAYKHFNSFQVLLGKHVPALEGLSCHVSHNFFSFQWFHPSDSFFGGLRSLGASLTRYR